MRIERKIRSEFGRFREAPRFVEGPSRFCGFCGTGEMPKRRRQIAPASKCYGMRSSSNSRNWPKRAVSVYRRESRVQGASVCIPSCSRRWSCPNRNGPQRVRPVRIRATGEQDQRLEQLKNRRDRVAEGLRLDPGVVAPRQALERISREPETAGTVLMHWQRQLLGL